ncbi:glycosyltransferase family 2 protein [Erwiniaceae bacterium CAU 1747]
MRLSIVVPCYNCAGNIVELLQMFWSQRNSEVEFIIINDGSTDSSEYLIKRFMFDHPEGNFNFHSTPNAGAAAARTTGLTFATGDYVFFCDSDDMIAHDFVASVLENIKKNPDLIYFSSVMASDSNEKGEIIDKIKFTHDDLYQCGNSFLYRQLQNKAYTAAVWTYIFRRELVNESNAYFTARKSHEDHLFTLRLIANAKSILIISRELYIQKITPGSLTNSEKDVSYIYERYSAFLESYNDMKSKFDKKTISLYAQWSVISFLSLLSESPSVIFKSRLFYSAFWKSRGILLKTMSVVLSKKISKKIKMD